MIGDLIDKKESRLKSCPFCGHEAVVDDCGNNSYFVRCTHCSINQDKLYSQRCDAIRAWNRRAEETKRGKWEDIVELDSGGYPFKVGVCCSSCWVPALNDDNYCPYCGAKMEMEVTE